MYSVRVVRFRLSSFQITFCLQSHQPMYLLMILSAKCIGCNVIRSLSLSLILSFSHSRSCHSGVWLRTLLSLVTDKQGAQLPAPGWLALFKRRKKRCRGKAGTCVHLKKKKQANRRQCGDISISVTRTQVSIGSLLLGCPRPVGKNHRP